MEELEDKLRSYYLSKKLTTGQVKSILDQKPGNLRASNLFRKALKYAAACIFLLGLSYSMLYLPYQKQKTILDNFAVEIIYNHQKNLPPEFLSQNIDELNQKLSKLDFELILPSKITEGKTLVGARYCSVDNRIAAQLKLINKAGQEETCYVFKNREKFSFDEDIEKQGVIVTLWNTQNLVFALAKDK